MKRFLLTDLLLAPLAALHAGEAVSLSADHAAMVNNPRRIFFCEISTQRGTSERKANNDPA